MRLWAILFFGVGLIGCGITLGYLWWGIPYRALHEYVQITRNNGH